MIATMIALAVACTDPWTHMDLLAPASVSAIVIAPSNPLAVYALVKGSPLLVSTDGGASFTATADTTVSWGEVAYLAVAPDNAARVYVGYADRTNRNLFRSSDGGASFEEIIGTGLGYAPLQGFFVGPSSLVVVSTYYGFASATDTGSGPQSFVRVPLDGVTQYTCNPGAPFFDPLASRLLASSYCGILAIDLATSELEAHALDAYFGPATFFGRAGEALFAVTESKRLVQSTNDIGWSFVTVDGEAIWGVSSLAIDPSDSAHMVMIADGSLYETSDGSATWTREAPSAHLGRVLFAAQFAMSAAMPSSPILLLQTAGDGVLSRSAPAGSTDYTANPTFDAEAYQSTAHALYLNGATAYAGTEAGFYRLVAGGFVRSSDPLARSDVHFFDVDPAAPLHILAASGTRALTSHDGGVSWAAYDFGAPVLGVVLGEGARAYATVSNEEEGTDLFVSSDGGATFQVLQRDFWSRPIAGLGLFGNVLIGGGSGRGWDDISSGGITYALDGRSISANAFGLGARRLHGADGFFAHGYSHVALMSGGVERVPFLYDLPYALDHAYDAQAQEAYILGTSRVQKATVGSQSAESITSPPGEAESPAFALDHALDPVLGSRALLLASRSGGVYMLEQDACRSPRLAQVAPETHAAGSLTLTLDGDSFSPGGALRVRLGDGPWANATALSPTKAEATLFALPGTFSVTLAKGALTSVLPSAVRIAGTAPSLVEVKPNVIPESTPVHVTITGAGFYANSEVLIGGLMQSQRNVAGSTLIDVFTSAPAPGLQDVHVRNGDGQTATLAAALTVIAQPRIASVEPQRVALGTTPVITLRGSGFQSGASVQVGEIVVSDAALIDAGTLTFTAPRSAPGSFNVRVSNTDGQADTRADALHYALEDSPDSAQPEQPAQGCHSGGDASFVACALVFLASKKRRRNI